MSTENNSVPSSPVMSGTSILMDPPRNGVSSSQSGSIFASSAIDGTNYAALSSQSSQIARACSLSDKKTKNWEGPLTPVEARRDNFMESFVSPRGSKACNRKALSEASITLAKSRARSAQRINDSMVYLDGPQIYTCAQCRTHLTSHDDIISKSFHGRHGRAYLFDQCVNVVIGPAEDRLLITGLHSVCDMFCKRCKGMVGWTYAKAYEASQKYKEGKYIIEKINLHMEESDYYTVSHPAGERPDRWRLRSMSWGSESYGNDIVYEYDPSI
eukprot:CAMPEP_0178932742 /NCGR_PEP_ID=MMETSP0786-20121207/22819_1 /TAXON_ID=186022 /ORGANISM="Thalassionema frauenfeldii, Strain CCMP 1798" /LENGTH=270 /DNA_ID=CAMNT_0020610133 /DNA_START=497 /DNA_END=1306 /DNA_ORIENTATION=-